MTEYASGAGWASLGRANGNREDHAEETLDGAELLLAVASVATDPAGTWGGLAKVMYTIVATVRGQQLARHLSLARGLDPDHPSGLTKVTPTH